MRGKTDGRDASPTVRVRFRLPVGDVKETAGRGRARGSATSAGAAGVESDGPRAPCQLARGLGLGEGCVVLGGGRRAWRVTSLHGDVLRGIHQLALTKGAGGPLIRQLLPSCCAAFLPCVRPTFIRRSLESFVHMYV